MTTLRTYLDEERGRGAKLAAELEVTQGAIWQWAESQVPAERVLKVAAITGLTVKDLRPDMLPREASQ